MEASSTSNQNTVIGNSATTKGQPRLRNLWTKSEDEILKRGAEMLLDQEGVTNAWSQIAASLPRRTNKDCRKRWMKVCKNVNKGAWTHGEDARLVKAVQQHGQSWTQVAQVVQTRHADQCAKRWQQSLDPSIVSERWRPRDDESLLSAVKIHGHKWKTIADEYFPRRSTTDIKNRYSSLTKERSSPASKYNNGTSDDGLRGLSPELDMESNYPVSDTERSGTGDIDDLPELEGMPDVDMGFSTDSCQSFTPTTIDLSTPTSMSLDPSMYSSAFDYSLIDHDPNFALTLTPPIDMDGLMSDSLLWDPSMPNSLDDNAFGLGLHSSLLDLKQNNGYMSNTSERGTPEPGIRRLRSKTTLVMEDVEPGTLCKVIKILSEANTKISMQSGDGDHPN